MLRVVVGGLVAARRAQGKRRQVSSALKANNVGSKTGKKDKKKDMYRSTHGGPGPGRDEKVFPFGSFLRPLVRGWRLRRKEKMDGAVAELTRNVPG